MPAQKEMKTATVGKPRGKKGSRNECEYGSCKDRSKKQEKPLRHTPTKKPGKPLSFSRTRTDRGEN